LSGAQAGALLALAGGMGLVGAPLGGVLADRIGRRRTLVAGLLASVAWFSAYGSITSVAGLTLLTLVGVSGDVYSAAMNAAVAHPDSVARPSAPAAHPRHRARDHGVRPVRLGARRLPAPRSRLRAGDVGARLRDQPDPGGRGAVSGRAPRRPPERTRGARARS